MLTAMLHIYGKISFPFPSPYFSPFVMESFPRFTLYSYCFLRLSRSCGIGYIGFCIYIASSPLSIYKKEIQIWQITVQIKMKNLNFILIQCTYALMYDKLYSKFIKYHVRNNRILAPLRLRSLLVHVRSLWEVVDWKEA